MARLTAGMASSHAFALRNPQDWDEGRTKNRKGYERQYGTLPPEHPKTAAETDSDVEQRYADISGALDNLGAEIARQSPDVLIVVGGRPE